MISSAVGPRGIMVLVIGVFLMTLGAWMAWTWQDNRYRAELAVQAAAYQLERESSALAVIDWQEKERGRQKALEERLQSVDQAHFKEFTDAQKNISQLRDRLATSDLRLSVLLASPVPGGGDGVSATTGTGSMVHGVARAELDRAHAQRIISIVGSGDEGLRALQACQAYVRSIASQ